MIEPSSYAAALAAYALAPPVEVFVLPYQGNSTQNVGIRSDAGEFILRTYTSTTEVEMLRYEHRLLLWLAEQGLSFAVPIPVPTLRGETLFPAPQGWQALFPRLPGSRLDWRDPDQVDALGAALGELHTTLSQYPPAPRPGVVPLNALRATHPWIAEPFLLRPDDLAYAQTPSYDQLRDWWQAEVAQLSTLVESQYQTLPWQVIHNDFIPNNTLVSARHVTAVLDFEFAAPDVRVLDVAIGLRNMLRVWENEAPWETVGRFCAGYGRWIRLSEGERAAIPWLMRLRNMWLVLKRVGRARTLEEVRPYLQHFEHAREFGQWLATHERRLVEILQTEAQ